ncbi:MAG: aminotransferase class I/II-fold pyridoxal phosphate-dependent enzyme, partial [Planctomycetia bacterium]
MLHPNRSNTAGPSTTAVHAGEARQKPGFAITDPIFAASTYTFPDTQSIVDFIEEKQPREEYGRYGNPGERVVEDKLAAIEGGEQAVLFASGMGALVGLLMAHLNAGEEIVFFDECYHRSREFCRKHLTRFGVGFREVRTCDYAAMEAAITPRTKFLVSESPTNPHLSVVDIERFADIGRRHGVLTLIDATLCTPYNLKPLESGVDFVLHSATKYLGGHNDLLAGVVIGARDRLEPVRHLRGIMGGVNSPHNAYLLERGLKTFALRMERHNANGLAVARFLETHPRVERVLYPGLESHPFHDIAACAEIAHAAGALLACDNTLATPALSRPLEMGADIVMHSATKYIGGHSDLLGGALVVRDAELGARLHWLQNATGGVMGPLESFLCSRGLK